MRIVGGALSGRRFAGPEGSATRPTSERVREAIASALEARGAIAGAQVLDLFAGTGALAFEALSRGAERAVLVEGDRKTARAIEASAASLGLSPRLQVRVADLDRPVTSWLSAGARFDLVFCDPPYAQGARGAEVLGELAHAGALAPEALVVLEHDPKRPPALPEGFSEIRSYRYGDTAVLLGTAPAERET